MQRLQESEVQTPTLFIHEARIPKVHRNRPSRFGWDLPKCTPETFKMDLIFFENWYAYQDWLIMTGQRTKLIQLLWMWDAGDSYLSPPSSPPLRLAAFRQTIV
ncbi:hypothetical protein F4778DRAFT_629912 [Xylariomycetidae sp. FL2044]|nr:hypothetical protein F4778DRAFT_629912 [Xylariomycetidae sp. FL2044]